MVVTVAMAVRGAVMDLLRFPKQVAFAIEVVIQRPLGAPDVRGDRVQIRVSEPVLREMRDRAAQDLRPPLGGEGFILGTAAKGDGFRCVHVTYLID